MKAVLNYIVVKTKVEIVMASTNRLKKAERVLARVLRVGRESSEVLKEDLDVQSLKSARLAMEAVSAVEVTPLVETKLRTLLPELSGGRWVTRGRLRKGLKPILGMKELVILLPQQRLAQLVMMEAHSKCHESTSGTLAKSRSRAWIVRVRNLAKSVAKNCVYCHKREAKLLSQRMGQLPIERAAINTAPFAGICLDLMGPVLIHVNNCTPL